jgi:hypothetical protein
LLKVRNMNTLTIRITNIKAKRLLKNLADEKFIEILGESNIDWTPKKARQAKGLLSTLSEVKKHEKGAVKLKTAKAFLNAL